MKYYKKELFTLIMLLTITNCSTMHPSKINSCNESQSVIKMPPNVISVNECIEKGGKVWNTLGETSYNGELIGTIKGLRCPCICLIESHSKSNTLKNNLMEQ